MSLKSYIRSIFGGCGHTLSLLQLKNDKILFVEESDWMGQGFDSRCYLGKYIKNDNVNKKEILDIIINKVYEIYQESKNEIQDIYYNTSTELYEFEIKSTTYDDFSEEDKKYFIDNGRGKTWEDFDKNIHSWKGYIIKFNKNIELNGPDEYPFYNSGPVIGNLYICDKNYDNFSCYKECLVANELFPNNPFYKKYHLN